MPGIPTQPGNISIIIGQPGNINVQVGSPQPRVTAISYGGDRNLTSAPDLDIGSGPTDGEVISYSANTGGFVLETLGEAQAPTEIDGGIF